MIEVFIRFFWLGCMSFGGPVAHIGYFQKEFVDKRKWLSEEKFTSGLSLCQFLPGPASSQLGMFIGFNRAGYAGAFAAFVAFTLPSFAFLTIAAVFSASLSENYWLNTLITSAKLLAVIVVADAIWTMAKKFISDAVTLVVCLLSAVWIVLNTGLAAQLVPIMVAGLIGWLFIKKSGPEVSESIDSLSLRKSLGIFAAFIVLLVLPAAIGHSSAIVDIFHHFYQAGSFVFGGGHVVLPLLQPLIGDSVSPDVLVEGYAAAQLVPGPMFTIASYIGASYEGIHPLLGSSVATIAVFLPGALLLFAALPIWQTVMAHDKFAGAVTLINAAVLGLLVAAFYTPVWMSAVHGLTDIIVVVLGLAIMRRFNVSVFWLLGGIVLYTLGIGVI